MSYKETHPNSFVHLHLHSMYSLLDGAIRLPDLLKKAKEFNMPAVAVTDHGNMFGAIDFYTRAKAAGVKAILGSEVYITSGSRFEKKSPKSSQVLDSQDEEEGRHHIHHLILLCKNQTGYQNLCKLISKAYMEGFYYKPRIDYSILEEHSEGLIAATACLKGEVGYNFFTNQDERAIRAIEKLRNIFHEDLYLEIQENGLAEQQIANKKIIDYARANNVKLVATCDAHYLTKDDSAAQEILLCIQTQKTYADEKRMKLTTQEFYFKSPEEVRAAFHYAPDACDNTLEIADKCNVEFKWKDSNGNQIYHLPTFEIKTGETQREYFSRVSKEGLELRFNGPHFAKLREQPDFETKTKKIYEERLTNEIEMICRMGFDGYFLIVSDFIVWSKQQGIPVGPGRGSGAGSLVAYSLQITNVDPIPYNLLFERFINPERISLPDFDIDFCQDRRQEVIDYVTKKYGEERVGQIITFGKLQAKAVIKDVSRVMGLSFSEADILSKLIPDELGITLERALEMEPKLVELEESDPKIKHIIKISRKLEGLLRHASIHAAGVIITNEPLVNYCPLFRGREGERVVQFDKDFSEKIGLVKFDFLGLKTLTVIDNAVKLIRENLDPNFDIDAIDLSDRNVYKFISTGRTTGIFQLESSGMKELCKKLRPDNLEDITAINALYRPGPLGSGMVDDFIEIKHGRKDISYPFRELEPVLKDTYGIIVYQEQVMNIARIVAGYSLGQADILRKAMGKKQFAVMEEHKKIFCEGAVKNRLDETRAAELYDLMAKFAEYGFNKSHAVAYALIAFQTAYLKCYHPGIFYAAMLGTEMGNADKVTGLIQDAKEFDIDVLPPDINESNWNFNVVNEGKKEKIRFALGAVKNVGQGAVMAIVKERAENGPYRGIIDFVERVDLKALNKRVLESLIKVGALDKCDKMNRKTMLENVELIMSYGSKLQEEKLSGQFGLFDVINAEAKKNGTQNLLNINPIDDFESKEKLQYERELLGIYVSGHPLDKVAHMINELSSMPISGMSELEGSDKRDVILAGMITQKKELLTKKGDKMCFLALEDLSGKMECVVFPKTFQEYNSLINVEEIVVMHGYVNLSEEPKKMIVNKIRKLKEEADEKVKMIRIYLQAKEMNDNSLEKIKQVLLSSRGSTPAHIIIENELGKVRIPLSDEFNVTPTPNLAFKLNEIIKNNGVKFIVDGKVEEGASYRM